jgi:hypothetical protein
MSSLGHAHTTSVRFRLPSEVRFSSGNAYRTNTSGQSEELSEPLPEERLDFSLFDDSVDDTGDASRRFALSVEQDAELH